MRNNVTRLMVEVAVSKALKEVSRGDMPRALRKLVDCGDHFASSAFPQELFSLMQQMLNDENHPYYTVARMAAQQTDKRYIMGFEINLGYECMSRAGDTIRQQHEKTGHWVPWIMGVPLPLYRPDLLRVPMSMGVMSYILLSRDAAAPDISAICHTYPNAAFFAVIPDALISEKLMQDLEGTDNLSVIPMVQNRHFTSGPVIRRFRRVYSPLFLLDEDEVDWILETEDLLCREDPDTFTAAFLPRHDVPAEKCAALSDLIIRRRLDPRQAMLPMDPTKDVPGAQQILTRTSDAAVSIPDEYDFSPLLLPDRVLIQYLESLA